MKNKKEFKPMTKEQIRAIKTEEEVKKFIREKLKFKGDMLSQLRHIGLTIEQEEKEHRRFEMSGYDGGRTGFCTLQNQAILNEFAYLGIYDYTQYLVLDFYKGTPTIYLKYWGADENTEIGGLDGSGTIDLIYKIFELTIFTNRTTRRRD